MVRDRSTCSRESPGPSTARRMPSHAPQGILKRLTRARLARAATVLLLLPLAFAMHGPLSLSSARPGDDPHRSNPRYLNPVGLQRSTLAPTRTGHADASNPRYLNPIDLQLSTVAATRAGHADPSNPRYLNPVDLQLSTVAAARTGHADASNPRYLNPVGLQRSTVAATRAGHADASNPRYLNPVDLQLSTVAATRAGHADASNPRYLNPIDLQLSTVAATRAGHADASSPRYLNPIDLQLSTVAATRAGRADASNPRYLNPIDLQLSQDAHRLYVVCSKGDVLLAVDLRTREVVQQTPVAGKPAGIAISPDGTTLYVTSELNNTITEIDAETLRNLRTLRTGWGPAGVASDAEGKFLYTANTLGNDVSVIEVATGRETKRLDSWRFPEYMARSRDGKWIYVSNLLANVEQPEEPPATQLAIIDATRQVVAKRILVPGVLQLRHITELPTSAGGYLLVPFMRPSNLKPLLQIGQGWYATHGMAVIRWTQDEQNTRVAEVLLDDVDQYFADGFGAASTPDGRLALITASSANVVSIVDVAKLNRLLEHLPPGGLAALPNRLDSAQQFVVARVRTGRNPTAVVVSPDSRFAYIANRMDDTISVIDLSQLKVVSTIDLGGPKEITRQRRGEQLFYDASYCYQGAVSCATCHPHQGFEDSLIWSMETPQLGRDVTENRTLLGIDGTSPFKWNGMNPDLETQDGPRTAKYIFRSQGFSPAEAEDLATYIRSLRLPPNPHAASGGHLTAAQARGQAIFYRTKTTYGTIIPFRDRCYTCHAPLTHYTSRVSVDVGTATAYDNAKEFDIPQLEGVYMRSPYLHNGEALSLEEIWTKFNPKDQHGITSDMTKEQLNDLIEFLKTL